ncbi:hypothetical protein C1T31_11855 [Hanstruepera neustonica]|uniref:Cytochrome oxidase subunit I profile domain-containing protein n=1 Tax=Hanstruepera neustonica TaxID=1445657 RepID=A0A2K1DWR0_9FLAO|nr:hypothetical protein [Hanstruepera neustonica]PNQ72477.1 hypothetical protein C1T31_11855 [Hanstruepera neustonica]
MHKKLILVCLINFLIAALMGLLLRYSFVNDVPFNYRFLTHAHSHVAMLGWVYLMLYTYYVHYLIPDKKTIYNRLFWVTEIAVIGMMISFPFQGYAAISISFSTLHIMCSYYFVFVIWKHLKTDSRVTKLLVRASLLFMLVSTLGVWCLGPAVATLGQTSAFYQIAIQFFLHFQFNGWFLIGVITILFFLLNIEYSQLFKYFFYTLISSTILTLALPIQWFAPHNSLLWINSVGVILQIISLVLFFKLIKQKLVRFLKKQSNLVRNFLVFAVLCLVLKNMFQLTSLFPEFAQIVYENRNFVIGFIHLNMLGVISGFLFAFIFQNFKLKASKLLILGVYTFICGFLLTELLIALQGYYFYEGKGIIDQYYLMLFLFSILLPIGITVFTITLSKETYEISK